MIESSRSNSFVVCLFLSNLYSSALRPEHYKTLKGEGKLEELYTVGNITDRENMTDELFLMYCSDYLSAVVGMVEWKEKETKMLISEIATPSDEAFCLVTLENNYERWIAIAKDIPRIKFETVIEDNKSVEKKIEQWPSPKYTKHKDTNGKKSEGWTTEGMEAYNNHYRLIKKLRGGSIANGSETTEAEAEQIRKNKKLEESYMDEKKKKRTNKKKRKASVFVAPKMESGDVEDIKF